MNLSEALKRIVELEEELKWAKTFYHNALETANVHMKSLRDLERKYKIGPVYGGAAMNQDEGE